MPSPYSSRHFKEESMCLVCLYPGIAVVLKGYNVLDQLRDTSKSSPTLASTAVLAVSTLFSKDCCSVGHSAKTELFGGATRVAQLTFYRAGFRMWQDPLSPISAEKQWHSAAKLCMLWAAESVFNLERYLLVASPLGVLIKSNHMFHWRPGPQVNNRHIKDGIFWAQLSRARRWMLKINQVFFFPSGSEFKICFSLLLCVRVALSPPPKARTHLFPSISHLHKQSIGSSWMHYRDKLSSV